MPIIVQQPGSTIQGVSYQAQDAINRVAQDVLYQLGPNHPALLDYCNRTQLELLKTSRWKWLWSAPQRFITQMGQTDYWIGSTSGSVPQSAVQTGLNLTDVQFIKANTVYDRSNNHPLSRVAEQPLFPAQAFPDASVRQGLPRSWRYDVSTPNVLSIYPAPQNSNGYLIVPQAPILTTTSGGSLPARTYYVVVTFQDSATGISAQSDEASIYVPAGSLVTVNAPQPAFAQAATGQLYNGWNVYIAEAAGAETKQNASVLSTDSAWTEPTSGLVQGTTPPGTASTIAPLGGYVIEFRYYRQRPQITQATQYLYVPDDYLDTFVAGVNALAFAYLASTDATYAQSVLYWEQKFAEGKIAIIRDKNAFPKDGGDFIHPDPASMSSYGLYEDWFFNDLYYGSSV